MGPSEFMRAAAIMLSSVMIGVQAAASTFRPDENMPPSPIEGMLETPHPPRAAARSPTLHTLDFAALIRLIGPLVPLSNCFCVR
jgi:hypothetical protein